MRNVVTQVHEEWRASSVLLNPGATAADLARLSDLLGIEPADVRRFYETVNGMVDYESAGAAPLRWGPGPEDRSTLPRYQDPMA